MCLRHTHIVKARFLGPVALAQVAEGPRVFRRAELLLVDWDVEERVFLQTGSCVGMTRPCLA